MLKSDYFRIEIIIQKPTSNNKKKLKSDYFRIEIVTEKVSLAYGYTAKIRLF